MEERARAARRSLKAEPVLDAAGLRAAVVASAGGKPPPDPADWAGLRTVVLVEGESDLAAVETLAERLGRDLRAEGVCVVPMGGATSIGHYVRVVRPEGLGASMRGLCDRAEARFFERALAGVGLGMRGFFVCDADLEDELIRALGVGAVERVVDEQGERRAYDIFRQQPAQRERTDEQRLHRFMGTLGGRKIHYGRALVEALDLDRVPRPLADLLADI